MMAKTLFPCLAALLLAVACSPRHTQDLREKTVVLSCAQPAFLQPGDKIALLSPSYHTPMENVEAAAAVLRGWGFEPVIGDHVGEVYRGKYAGRPKERVSDLEWALKDPSSTLLRDLLLGQVPAYKVPAHPENRPGHATGILVGGNLCTFTPILGTTADATLGRDIILFIEEVGEDMSHIDRLINTLVLNGVFERCKGVILGEFTDCKANLDFDSVEEMVSSYVPADIPVLCGFPTGHDDVNLPLVMGAPITLDVTPAGGSLTFGMQGRPVPVRTEDTVATPFQGGQKITEGKKQRRLVRIVDFLRHFEGIRR